MSQPIGPRSSSYPLEPPPADDGGSLWSSDDAAASRPSEPTDLRSRLAEVSKPAATTGAGILTYEPYYGLKEKPFSLSTDPRFLYKSGSHGPVFHDLLSAIRRREGLVVLTGDIGAGKTTLCRAVLEHLDRKTFTTFVPDPFVSREDLLKMLLVEFGVVSVEDVRRGRLQGASRVELSYPLYEFLKSLGPLEAFAVLVIDEAQNLSLPLLEEIRILSDLEDDRKLLQVVLVGQPEFREHLKAARMRQVDQRVSMRCELRPLTREGITNYVAYRLSTAGGHSDRVSFAPAALDLVFQASGGIPRVINLICDRALERGHRSSAAIIGPDLVGGAIGDLHLEVPSHAAGHRPPAVSEKPQAASEKAHIASPLPQVADEKPQVSVPPAPAAVAPFTEPVVVAQEPPASAAEVTAPAAARGLFGKQAGPAETVARTSELDALLDLPATTTRNGNALLMRPTPPPAEVGELTQRSKGSKLSDNLRRSHARRFGLVPTAALVFIGTLTGVSLVGYLLWMGPLLKESTKLPPVAPVAGPSATAQVKAAAPAAASPKVNASEPGQATVNAAETRAATSGKWAVQVAAFTSVSRTRALVDQLSAAGFPSYEGPTNVGRLGLRLVLVGPYPTSEAASSIRDQIRELPGLDGALLRDLETGENF